MARTTPRVEQGILVLPTHTNAPVAVGSRQWFSWLADEGNASFYFANEAGSFTARKERRQRGGWYWIAYRSRGGRLAKAYIGRNEDLTSERLNQVTDQLTEQKTAAPDGALSLLAIPTTRFTPPTPKQRGNIVERPALLERLDESLRVKLTLVVAPAGFGKTTLLSTWYERFRETNRVQRKEDRCVWIALDRQDNEQARFWTCLWSALKGGQGLDQSTPLFSTPQMAIETVLTALLNGVSQKRNQSIVILDDYHTISNEQIHAGMDFLLAHLPPTVHIILASRSEPPLVLGRSRMYGELIEMGSDDLRLNSDEIERYLNGSASPALSASEKELLTQRTEGWVAGLRLVTLALAGQQQPGEVMEHFTGGQSALFTYFAEEVFTRQPAEVQHFLLVSSLLNEFTPALCAAVLAEGNEVGGKDRAKAQTLLMQVERANLFIIALDEQRYRYHALFTEFLQERLQQRAPALALQTRQRASIWYAHQGLLAEAIEYAISAHDSERASMLIEQHGEEMLWRRGEIGRLLTWLQELPFERQGASVRLKLLYAWALLLSGQQGITGVEELLDEITSQQEAVDSYLVRGEIAALRARLASFHNDNEQALKFGRQALAELPREKALLRADVAFGMNGSRDLDEAYRMLSEALHISQALGSLRTTMFASRYLASVCMQQGRLTEAEAIHQQALRSIETRTRGVRSEQVPAAGVVFIGQAELLYERNELVEALRCAQRGIELGGQSGEIKALLAGHNLLCKLYAAMGDLQRAQQELWRCEEISLMSRVPWMGEDLAAGRMHLALLQNDVEGAKRALRRIELDPDHGSAGTPALEREFACLLLSRVWLAEKKYNEAREMLEPLVEMARQQRRTRTLFAAQALLAAAFLGLEQPRRAAQLLSEVLTMAEAEGYMRIFLDPGEPVLDVLKRPELAASTRGYARKLLEAAGKSDQWRKSYSDLSEREYEVLRLLAAGLSNQEIAETLVVAASTVKVHVRHLCQKLGVERRLQAVTKAREMGLL